MRIIKLGEKLILPLPLPDVLQNLSGKNVMDNDLYSALTDYRNEDQNRRGIWLLCEKAGLKLYRVNASDGFDWNDLTDEEYDDEVFHSDVIHSITLWIAIDSMPETTVEISQYLYQEYGNNDLTVDEVREYRYPTSSTDTEHSLKIDK